jgi:hypothetical protein
MTEVLEHTIQAYMQKSDEWHEKLSDKIEQTYIQAVKTNGRVNGLEKAVTDITEIIKRHDNDIRLLSNTKQQFIGAVTLFSVISASIIGLAYYAATKYAQDISARTVAEVVPREIQKALDQYNVQYKP